MAANVIKNEDLKHAAEDVLDDAPNNSISAAHYSPPSHFSPNAEQHMPIPFEFLDFTFDPSYLATDHVYDATLSGKRYPTGSSILEPDAILDTDGRTYHSYTQGSLYFLPNDGIEQDRLDLQHSIFDLLLEGKLALAPIDSPRYVLDVATGTGIWSISFAEQNPSSHVIGTDLSLIQPVGRLPNCEFVREDVEVSEWIFPHLFDYVHLRNIAWCFDNTKLVFQRAFDHLAPGGWIEIQDPTLHGYYTDGSFEGTAMDQYIALLIKGMAKLGRIGNRPPLYKSWLEEIGFVEVEQRIMPCPFGPWPKNPKMKKIGTWQAQNFLEMVDGVRKLAVASGTDEAQVDVLAKDAKIQLASLDFRMIVNYYMVYARKPLNAKEQSSVNKADIKGEREP